MKRKLFPVVAILLLMSLAFSVAVSADVGPKPSIVVDFSGLEGMTYYATLLSDYPQYGPHSSVSSVEEATSYIPENDTELVVFQKFIEYQDVDGYYFLQVFENCSDTHQFSWGYLPPDPFKILLYFPDQDCFVAGDILETYAFDSYFSATVSPSAIQPGGNLQTGMTVKKSYNYTGEILTLIIRIALTVAVEMGLAWAFGFRLKKQLRLILIVNLCTQIILNLLLNYFNHQHGLLMFVLNYIWMELVVVVFELIFYTITLGRLDESGTVKAWKPPVYAIVANGLSFGVGLCLGLVIPMIF